jgi:hypothetical protein
VRGASQDFARAFGAVWAGGSDEPPPEMLDAAIIFAPVGALVPAALAAVKKGGRVTPFGTVIRVRQTGPRRRCLHVALLAAVDPGLRIINSDCRPPTVRDQLLRHGQCAGPGSPSEHIAQAGSLRRYSLRSGCGAGSC